LAQLRAAQERDLTEDRQRIVAREQDLTQLRAAREQDLTQLRAARERVLRRLRAVQEQAMTRDRQRLAAREPGPDVPELWRISEEEAAAILTELLSGSEDYRQCNLCHTLESFLMHGVCRCPGYRNIICKSCYWGSVGAGQTRCAFCRAAPLR
jgi:hypothetical protein